MGLLSRTTSLAKLGGGMCPAFLGCQRQGRDKRPALALFRDAKNRAAVRIASLAKLGGALVLCVGALVCIGGCIG